MKREEKKGEWDGRWHWNCESRADASITIQ